MAKVIQPSYNRDNKQEVKDMRVIADFRQVNGRYEIKLPNCNYTRRLSTYDMHGWLKANGYHLNMVCNKVLHY